MRSPRCAVLVACALVLALLTTPLASAAPTEHAGRRATTDLEVGSYNIVSVQVDSEAGGEQRTWRERRPHVIGDIIGNGIDVLGVQEAYNNAQYASQLVEGPNQYIDLKEGLLDAGGSYALVDENPDTSRQTRILYDTSVVTPVSSGYHLYKTQPASYLDRRHLVWAVFTINATGRQFFFSTTHLMNDSPAGQRAQWVEMIDEIGRQSAGLPVIATGDFQKSKKDQPAIDMLRKMKRAGFGDVVGQRANTYEYSRLRARRTKNAWINSTNHWQRNVRRYSNRKGLIANNIDYVFASNELPVLEWKVCANLAPGKRLRGVIPSDHFLVRAIVRV